MAKWLAILNPLCCTSHGIISITKWLTSKFSSSKPLRVHSPLLRLHLSDYPYDIRETCNVEHFLYIGFHIAHHKVALACHNTFLKHKEQSKSLA